MEAPAVLVATFKIVNVGNGSSPGQFTGSYGKSGGARPFMAHVVFAPPVRDVHDGANLRFSGRGGLLRARWVPSPDLT